ncbi:MAG: 2-octaprenyl-6-methoxyphenyl hydroxylase, partial [Candidatus Competibacteraceae bacterium]|nr:2-octaprenyl-6-methoxyphenyl hydroxylase [Candidatus Competibacteraceae bacterium]
ACALGGRGLTVGLVDAHPLGADHHPGYDERTLALSLGTRRIFATLGLWPQLAEEATPIHKIHISDRGRPGIAHLDCREEGVDALGYVIPARVIGTALAQRLEGLEGVEMLMPATLETVDIQPQVARAVINTGEGQSRRLEARLLVAADGARSRVREQLGIDTLHWDYGQSAVIANVTPRYSHDNVAYERFTPAGPLALLPLSGDRCAVVCTVERDRVEEVLALDERGFAEMLLERFGDRLGAFQRVGGRQAYPLYLVKSREHVRPRVAVIGNAAHTLHPIAGQGFNLGIRDVATLAEVVADAHGAGRDFGSLTLLERYGDWRRWDQRRTIAFTDGLARLFGNPLPPVAAARNLGLLAFDLLPPAKRWLARQAMGLDGRLPRLARGLPL